METFNDFSYLDEPPAIKLNARIAALEAQIARLTAPVTEEEMRRLDDDWAESKDDTIEAYRGASPPSWRGG